jgi:hypothetical protein
MRGKKNIPGRKNEQGTIITLVAVFMLFVVGAMAALSIDAVTIYTARSEAQLAADGAALAAARVIANSGATSDSSGALLLAVETIPGGPAQAVAIQVAQNSMVGGRYLVASNGEVVVTFSGVTTNPRVSVRTQRTDLPTFFARIWGNKQVTVGASATAEAYNPSGGIGSTGTSSPPVAPLCVKPWLLPNLDPSTSGTIFNATGGITNPLLLGWSSITAAPTSPMTPACTSGVGGDCSGGALPPPTPWIYYPGDPSTFPPPTTALPTCSLVPTLTAYQASVAGCIQTPISCNINNANVDITSYTTRNSETADAVNCLAHDTTSGGGDTVAPNAVPASAPFQFLAGNNNPVVAANADVMVSDSLVTVPVFDNGNGTVLASGNQLVGFVQLFLNPDSTPSDPATGKVNTTIINMAGCGPGPAAQPIFGNGASPVAVRLISGT